MHIAISAPIKKDFQKEVEALFPGCQISWMEEMGEDERLAAIRTADVVLTHGTDDADGRRPPVHGSAPFGYETLLQCRRLGARHRRVDGGDDHRAEPLPERAAP